MAYVGTINVVCASSWTNCKPWPPTLNVTVIDGDLDQVPSIIESVSGTVSMYKYGSEEYEVLNITQTSLNSFSFTANLPMLNTGVPDCGCGSCAPCVNPACCAQALDGVMFAPSGDQLQAVYKDASPPGFRIWSEKAGTVGSLVFVSVDAYGAFTPCTCYCDGRTLCYCQAPIVVGNDFNMLLTDVDIPATQSTTVAMNCFRSYIGGTASDSEVLTLTSNGISGQFTGAIQSISSNVVYTPYNGTRVVNSFYLSCYLR